MAAAGKNEAGIRVQNSSYVRLREIGLYYNIPHPREQVHPGSEHWCLCQ